MTDLEARCLAQIAAAPGAVGPYAVMEGMKAAGHEPARRKDVMTALASLTTAGRIQQVGDSLYARPGWEAPVETTALERGRAILRRVRLEGEARRLIQKTKGGLDDA